MSTWVSSNNPTTTYRAEDSLKANGEMDWIVTSNFQVGDTVYIYEVLPPRGRGGIVYKTTVTQTGVTLDTKIDDREYWIGGDYPKYITSETRFNRLKLVAVPRDGIIPYKKLKEEGFTAPQFKAHSLDHKPHLLNCIQEYFS